MKGLYCSRPFQNIEIHNEGEVYFCCPQWLALPIGNIKKGPLLGAWNSDTAQKIRDSILDGSYRFCDHRQCPYIASRSLETKARPLEVRPSKVMLVYDQSCNLSCPSCRNELKMFGPGSAEFQKAVFFNEQVLTELIGRNDDLPLTLNITGSGDPFASPAFKELLLNLSRLTLNHLKIDVQTNALLFTESVWEKYGGTRKNFGSFFVSIDAASKATYEIVRRGGSWETLLKNMHFLAGLRHDKKIDLLQARFVVQKKNFREMGEFVSLFLGMGCDVIEFSLLADWGSWQREDFFEQSVCNPAHPDYKEFLGALCDHRLGLERVFLGNVAPFRELALKERTHRASAVQRLFWQCQGKVLWLINILERQKIKTAKKLFQFIFKRN